MPNPGLSSRRPVVPRSGRDKDGALCSIWWNAGLIMANGLSAQGQKMPQDGTPAFGATRAMGGIVMEPIMY